MPGIFSFRMCPEINHGFGSWYHGTKIRRWQSSEDRALKIARRFVRLYRTNVKLYATSVDSAGIVKWEDPREIAV